MISYIGCEMILRIRIENNVGKMKRKGNVEACFTLTSRSHFGIQRMIYTDDD